MRIRKDIISGTNYTRTCIVCKKVKVKHDVWICDGCYRYIGKETIADTIEKCGSDYSRIPEYIPEEQYDNYFVKLLNRKRVEMGMIKKETKKQPISIAARKAKARELQKLVAQKISDLTGIPCGKDELIESREMGQAGSDIKLIGPAKKKFPFAIECKRQEKFNLHEAVKQAKANQEKDMDWLVVSRRSNEDAIVSMDMDAFFRLCKKAKNETT